jgi:hypothetical protein
MRRGKLTFAASGARVRTLGKLEGPHRQVQNMWKLLIIITI